MRQRRKFFSLGLAWHQRDFASCGSASRWSDVLRILKSDALLGDQLRKALTVLARPAVDTVYCRKSWPQMKVSSEPNVEYSSLLQ